MRIISGSLGGRRINPPNNMPYTRPTTDIAKEGLFNILQNSIDFEGIKTLDLFGGTGSITYELFSRGATEQIVVEKDSTMHAFIAKKCEEFKIDNVKILKMDIFKYLESCQDQFDFIFAGPPYALATIDDIPKIIMGKNLLQTDGLFVLEHTPRNNYTNYKGFTKERNYGTTLFSFFENETNA
jgi:16S rRNA (guanine966-N2)-methyltransferase